MVNSISTGDTANSAVSYSEERTQQIDISQIDSVFVTTKKEDDRTTFEESFEEININDKNMKDAKAFLQGLTDNKNSLMADLNLTSEQYDSMCCVALALASQETGMGLESGYKSENRGIGLVGRILGKIYDVHVRHNGSASSGLTQMKIQDFLQSDTIDETSKELLKKYGIKSYGITINNLFKNPDKAAIATMVILSDFIRNNYDTYINTLEHGFNKSEHNSHEDIRPRLDSNLTDEQCVDRGNNILDSIMGVYQNLNDEDKEKLRTTLKNWMLSNDGSLNNEEYLKEHAKDADYEYCEEANLQRLNDMLNKHGLELNQEDLDYIRYALTREEQKVNAVEFLAYFWNNGPGSVGMTVDRILADKIGTIFYNPEDFDYGQFSINVETLASLYAEASGNSLDNVIAQIEQLIK